MGGDGSQQIILCRQHTLKKLVPETCTCVGQSQSISCTSFFLVVQVCCTQLIAALFQHRNCPTRDINRARVVFVQETVMKMRRKFFVQVSGTSFLSVCLRHYSCPVHVSVVSFYSFLAVVTVKGGSCLPGKFVCCSVVTTTSLTM